MIEAEWNKPDSKMSSSNAGTKNTSARDNYEAFEKLPAKAKKMSATARKLIWLFIVLLLSAAVAFFLLKPSGQKKKEVVFSEEDGFVRQVADYIKQNETKYPESFVAVHWTNLQQSKDLLDLPTYQVGVIYKIKNEDGKTVMKSKMFQLNADGTILLELSTEPFKF